MNSTIINTAKESATQLQKLAYSFLPTKVETKVNIKGKSVSKFIYTPLVFNNAKELFKKMHDKYPCTQTQMVLGAKKNVIINSGYRVDIRKSITKGIIAANCVIAVSYNHNDINFCVLLNPEEHLDLVKKIERPLLATEFDSFKNRTKYELNKVRLQVYEFTHKQVKWEGGDITLNDPQAIQSLINKLIS